MHASEILKDIHSGTESHSNGLANCHGTLISAADEQGCSRAQDERRRRRRPRRAWTPGRSRAGR